MLKKIFISLLLALFVFTSIFVKQAQALEGGTWYNQSFKEWYSKVYDNSNPQEIFGERYTAGQVQWILYALPATILSQIVDPQLVTCFMQGQIDDCADLFADRLTTIPGGYSSVAERPNQSVPRKDLLSDYLETNPVSGIGYVLSRYQNWGLIDEAQAQGVGYEQLENTVLTMWKAFRNISYAIFVIAVVATAFMIMFRVKISPQAVITVQSALPKIVIALVLITFSYAIAGFLIDLVYVLIGLVATIFTSGTDLLQGTAWRDLFDYLVKGPLDMGILGIMSQYTNFIITSFFFVAFQVTFSRAVFLGLLLLILSVLLPFILSIMMIVLVIKTFIFFIKTYMNIILSIIFAPLQIAAGIIVPSAGFGAWLRSLAANLAVYPVSAVFIILSFMFAAEGGGGLFIWLSNARADIIEFIFGSNSYFPFHFDRNMIGNGAWNPPLTVGTGPLQPLLFLGISYSIMAMIPKVGEIIKSMIEGKPFGYGSAIGESFGPMQAIWKSQPAQYGKEAVVRTGAKEVGSRMIESDSKVVQRIGETLDQMANKR